MKKFLFGLILGGAIVFVYFFTKENPDNTYVVKVQNLINKVLKRDATTGLANPASTYCIQNNGTLDIQEGTGGSTGTCRFSDGSSCEERAFFRGECKPSAQNEINSGTVVESNSGLVADNEEPAICTMEYAPVCAKVQVQCIKAPCEPIEQTFGNKCQMGANKLATFIHEGECGTGKTECPILTPPSPDFCKDGKIVDKGLDTNGCQLPPECVK